MMMGIKKDITLKSYSSMSIGGDARYLVEVSSIEEMIEAIGYAKKQELSYLVIGKGSNFLFDDSGYEGLIIINKINYFEHKEDRVFIGAGYSFSSLGAKVSQKGFSGLEFAAGIPGSVGGAIYMNAGASGQETKDCLESVSYLDESLNLLDKQVCSSDFSYRSSIFQKMRVTIVGAEFKLMPDFDAKIRQREILKSRVLSQPYDKKSVGCIFKNPKGKYAGALIQECGLMGFRIGNAKVSFKHANFLINLGQASSRDVKSLITHIQKVVLEKKGIKLDREVRFFDEL